MLLCHNQPEIRINKNTPAVTIVAAGIKAETGVGPSIAAGNHVCKPICADLPTAAIKNKHPAAVIIQKLSLLKNILLVNIVEKFTLPTQNNTNPTAAIKLISPTRLTIIAFKAALLACKRVYQKLINK